VIRVDLRNNAKFTDLATKSNLRNLYINAKQNIYATDGTKLLHFG